VNVTIRCTDGLEGINCTRPKNPALRSRALEARSVHWKSYNSALEMCLSCTGKSHLVHWKVDGYITIANVAFMSANSLAAREMILAGCEK
jgi:hypothetical protein